MLETIAMILFALWAVGLVTGNSLAGGIHVLLLAGLVVLYFHRRAVARARSIALIGSSRMLAQAMGRPSAAGRPVVPAKQGQGSASRPSAAA